MGNYMKVENMLDALWMISTRELYYGEAIYFRRQNDFVSI